jgi:hypothetical protein
MCRFRTFAAVCCLSLSFMVMVGTSGADPRPSTPAQVKQEQKDTGNYMYNNRPY